MQGLLRQTQNFPGGDEMKILSLLSVLFVIFTHQSLLAEEVTLNLSYTMTECDNMNNQCSSQAPDFKQVSIALVADKKDPRILTGKWHKVLLAGAFTFNAYVDVTKTPKGFEFDMIVDSYKENPIDELTSVSGGVFVDKLEDLNKIYLDGHWQFDLDNFISYAPTLRIQN